MIRTPLPNVGKLVWVTGGGKGPEERVSEEEWVVKGVGWLDLVEKELDDGGGGLEDAGEREEGVEVKSKVVELEPKVVRVERGSVVSDESNEVEKKSDVENGSPGRVGGSETTEGSIVRLLNSVGRVGRSVRVNGGEVGSPKVSVSMLKLDRNTSVGVGPSVGSRLGWKWV